MQAPILKKVISPITFELSQMEITKIQDRFLDRGWADC
jgi:hypothetical protein